MKKTNIIPRLKKHEVEKIREIGEPTNIQFQSEIGDLFGILVKDRESENFHGMLLCGKKDKSIGILNKRLGFSTIKTGIYWIQMQFSWYSQGLGRARMLKFKDKTDSRGEKKTSPNRNAKQSPVKEVTPAYSKSSKSMKYLPYTFPSQILEFMHKYITSQFNDLKPGQKKELRMPSIFEYFGTIPPKYREKLYADKYHNALLKVFQLMSVEGLITPENNSSGIYQKFQMNGFDFNLAKYGYYDFLILGFQYIRDKFDEAVRPLIVNQGSLEMDEDIGSGFSIVYNQETYFVTARHCIPAGSQIYIPAFLPQKKPLIPTNIWVPENDAIDLAVIKFDRKSGLDTPEWLWVGEPYVLDEVMTMGYPPIQGFTDAILVSETAKISSFLRATTGEITGEGQHYWGGNEDHFLISARVKGGNSGGPVINKKGEVVGVIIELLKDGESLDLLGYGVALSSRILIRVLDKITGKSDDIEIKELEFETSEKGFKIK